MVSGSISLLCSRFFSPFLHSTGSLSVSREYLALRDGPRRFTQNSSCSGLLRSLLSCGFDSLTRLSLSLARLSNRFGFSAFCYVVVLLPQLCRNIIGLGSSAFARHYLRNHYYFLFLRVLRCFSSPGWPDDYHHIITDGFPHSDICGSRVICTSPQLFAAYHVLLRLREPRHPPYALCYFLRCLLFRRPRCVGRHYMSFVFLLVFLSFFQYVKDLFFSWRITDSNR